MSVRAKDINVPAGFAWDHVAEVYKHPDGRWIDGKSGKMYDRTGREVVESTSDQRVANNTMRHQYRVLNDDEKAKVQAVKDAGEVLHNLIEGCGSSRELSLAKTKVEEAVFWAVKHLTK